MCPVIDPHLFLHSLGIIFFVLFLFFAFAWLVWSILRKKKKIYSIYILLGGVIIGLAIFLIGPLVSEQIEYQKIPGPAFEVNQDLKSFIESRQWRYGTCGGRFYTFKSDGTYIFTFASDYPTQPIMGTWKLIDKGHGRGELFLSNSTLETIPIQAKGKYLIFNNEIPYRSAEKN